MIAVAIAALALAAAAVAACVYFGRAALSSRDGERAASEIARAAERAQADAEDATIDAQARAAAAELAAAQATKLLAAERSRSAELEGRIQAHVEKVVATGSAGDLAGLVNELLGPHLPGPADYHAASRDAAGAADRAAVRPAEPAGGAGATVVPAAGRVR